MRVHQAGTWRGHTRRMIRRMPGMAEKPALAIRARMSYGLPSAPLFATARSLKGVGPQVEGLLNKLVAPRHEGGACAGHRPLCGICRSR